MEVVKTTAAGHARKLAATVDINTCPDGKSRMLFYALVFFFFSSVALAYMIVSQELYALEVMEL